MAYVGHVAPVVGRLSSEGAEGGSPQSTLPDLLHYRNIHAELDAPAGIWWARMAPLGRPSFTDGLLHDIGEMHRELARVVEAAPGTVRHVVLGSSVPGIYNLGGDLALFARLIRAGDLEGLRRYGRVAVEAIHRNHTAFGLPVTTIALVQGDALGGGFECALAHDVIVAERGAKFGLPEVLFNLFPGMGAYSFLSRRIGRVAAERMILSGRIYGAAELHEMGLVDVLAEDGEGEQAVRDYTERTGRRFNAHRALYETRRRVEPVTLHELRHVVDGWAEAALNLGEADLRKMLRLAGAQDRRMAGLATA
ncbi:crotonase/enoyl-CoA hydratase family protein [Muricoccus aerilatus]|uniref:crotonase/enoyl-CoA hydratase family protein n=1 Tax=Muricoccus aerilatus TaxID=452982 RepID=UPI0005C1BEE9|nr:crotonase/enoyl-CoA hydratase family protein [Roseomonas aerilata]